MGKRKGQVIPYLVLLLVVIGFTSCSLGGDTGQVLKQTPVFSKESGFYAEEFELNIRTSAGLEVVYTMDGSDPRTSDTAKVYEGPIRIYDNTNEPNRLSSITDITLGDYYPPEEPVEKGIIIRATSKDKAGNFSEVVTHSYFVGKVKPYYSEMKVISLVVEEDYLFDPETGHYMVGSGYYEWLQSDEHQEYDSGDVNNPTNYNAKGRETEFPVTIQVFEEGKEVFSANVGARISGNWSRASAQKSIRLYARKEYGEGKMKYAFFEERTDLRGAVVQAYDKVTLRNAGNDNQTLHFRDAFLQELAKGLEVDYMAAEPCILFLNGEFWGFYFIREKADDEYIEAIYGIDKDNVAVIKNGEVESGDESDLEEFNDFIAWAQAADMSQQENYEKFCKTIDVQSFMDYVTVQTYINNADWLNGYVNNWQVWHTRTVDNFLPKADGKWRFVFYDIEYSAGLYYADNTSYKHDSLNNNRAGGAIHDFLSLLDNLMANQEFAEQFHDNYLRIIEECFEPGMVNELISTYVSAYQTATKDTFYRFGMGWAADGYSDSVSHMRAFFYKRPENAKKYLEEFCKKDRSGPKAMIKPVEQWGYYGEAEFTVDAEANTFYVSVPKATPESWNIQSQIHGITLEKGKQYRITFQASCTTPCDMSLGINRQDNGEYPNCFWDEVYLTEELKEYTITFTMKKETYYDWYLNFNFGDTAGDYVIQDVVMEEITPP